MICRDGDRSPALSPTSDCFLEGTTYFLRHRFLPHLNIWTMSPMLQFSKCLNLTSMVQGEFQSMALSLQNVNGDVTRQPRKHSRNHRSTPCRPELIPDALIAFA